MDRLKMYGLITIMALGMIVIAGCVSSSGDNNTNTKTPMIVATIGAPTAVPTEPPEATVGPTWVPTPTPTPLPMTLSNFNITVTVNADIKAPSGDPNQSLQENAQYAMRQDKVSFKVQNTGDATLNNVEITYQVVTPMSVIDGQTGQEFTTDYAQTKKFTFDKMDPGVSKTITLDSPLYGAMLAANVTVSAKWDGGSLDLYKTTLQPNFNSGLLQSPPNDITKTYGSAYNY
jgi:hypothetical protein